jgi:hypothetical protein
MRGSRRLLCRVLPTLHVEALYCLELTAHAVAIRLATCS